MPLKLYHGTSSKFRSSIERRGLDKFTWTTNSLKVAKTFARVKQSMIGGRFQDVWEIKVEESSLESDAWCLGYSSEDPNAKFYKFHSKPPGDVEIVWSSEEA